MSKRWMVTVFTDNVDFMPPCDATVAYGVWQRERCPETGRSHVHVYYRFNARKRPSTIKNWLGREDAHLEIAKGSEKDCRDYCTKDDSRLEAGTEFNPANYDPSAGKQGKRSDLDAIAEKCRAGVPIVTIANDHPGDFIRYHTGIQALADAVAPAPPVEREVSVLVLWGATGLGKTHRVLHANPVLYQVHPGRDPWGQYKGEPAIFFDEFNWESWPIQDMNRYLDKWRCPLDARYRNRYAAWTHVAICANCSPASWYPLAPGPLLQAFRRRLQNCCRLVLSQEQPIAEMENTPFAVQVYATPPPASPSIYDADLSTTTDVDD